MPAEVETMMYVREKPWHGLGTRVENAVNSKEALKLAGLDWEVIKEPVYNSGGQKIKNYHANTRATDGSILGIVSNRYSIIQNHEAFDFTDSLVGEELYYETAGSLRDGKQIWLLGKLPERTIVGDKLEPYICFINSHDGTAGVKCCMTPIRVVCNNTLNLALNGAKRVWSTTHTGNVQAKLQQAKVTLGFADLYLQKLDEASDELANQSFSEGEMRDVLNDLFPTDDISDKQKQHIEDIKDKIIVCTLSPDLLKFANTKWAFVNGVADFIGHKEPLRKTKNYAANRWKYIMNGHSLLDRALAAVK